MRSVIVHNHLFKNAGTTIDWALERIFGTGFCDHRDNVNMFKGAEFLGPYLLENPEIIAISSHQIAFPLPEIESLNCIPITMLRHPIERIASVYTFETKQKPAVSPGAIFAQKHSFNEYVAWRMRPDIGATIRNFHTVKCANKLKRPRFGPQAEHFKEAMDAIENENFLFGIVELFDESMLLFELSLRKYFPTIDMSYITQNAGLSKKKSFQERLQYVEDNLSPETLEMVYENNQYDIPLFEKAKKLILQKIQYIDNFDELLIEYRKRCKINHKIKEHIK